MTASATIDAAPPSVADRLRQATYRKVSWRIVPLLMLCYTASYLDRVNIGFAKLQMSSDLGFSDAVFGLGAGIFFIGYVLFEVPSNLLLARVGAKVWIARIMITWGLISGCFVFVQTPTSFYILRFLLGMAEAGFYPGVILYLTYWYPANRRARIIATFTAAIALAGVLGGPLSGWLLEGLHGAWGWAGWKWLFLVEALPSVIMGVVVLAALDDRPEKAKWLNADERRLLHHDIEQDREGKIEHASVGTLLTDPRIWRLSAIYLSYTMGLYGLAFWMPTLVRASGVTSAWQVGLITALPYACAVVSMLTFGTVADRSGRTRGCVALALALGAVGLAGSVPAAHQAVPLVILLCVAACGILSAPPVFWKLPTGMLSGMSAAAGIALINAIGNIGGFVSPYLLGWLSSVTHSTAAGMYCLAAVMALGALCALGTKTRQTLGR
ncbi:MFS transporter [Caballeronia sp. LZ035]|uniref:MFS transporter n=1 Tax=Caballeronia sp. LZ035 TaxID=3038568 RepID=UPI002859F61C|nr:MFS transporter [Caballeronia sp. LZ035]MDR5758928.1 MFS transporter [Caballeronia sp. LZ035]